MTLIEGKLRSRDLAFAISRQFTKTCPENLRDCWDEISEEWWRRGEAAGQKAEEIRSTIQQPPA